eukprot:42329-Eustigmatos_ZCMA.PRE.1
MRQVEKTLEDLLRAESFSEEERYLIEEQYARLPQLLSRIVSSHESYVLAEHVGHELEESIHTFMCMSI